MNGTVYARLAFYLLPVTTVLMIAALTMPAYAANIEVTTTTDEDNSDGDCSLREAIIAANTDATRDACAAGNGTDTVTVPADFYSLSVAGQNEDAASTGDLDIIDPDGLTISGAEARSTYVIADSPDRLFDIRPGASAEITGLTIFRGHADQGAGVRNYGTLTLRQMVLSSNEAVGPMGGISFAGGIFGNGGTLNIIDSTVSENSATFGSFGGVYQQGGTANITNTTISGNSTVGINSGVQAFSGATVNIESSTIASNTSTQPGGGIHANGNTTTINVENSIVSGNTLDNCDTLNGGTINSLGYNISSDGSCSFTQPTDRQNADPLMGRSPTTEAPPTPTPSWPGSPAIDEGASDQAQDQRGEGRPRDGDGDGTSTDGVGAFESETPPPPTPFTVNESDDAADADITDDRCDTDSATTGRQCTLRAAIEEANDTFGADTIDFDLGGTGATAISPTSALPTIIDSVTIDGYTQPGASPNSLEKGNDAVIKVLLGGLSAGAGVDGLVIEADNCTIRGLLIRNFGGSGILITGPDATGNNIEGNFIGLNRDGVTEKGNGAMACSSAVSRTWSGNSGRA